ncbi:MAG: hypothetical protein IJ040_01080 [Lachnospiraceae bacterium]|nr:hypothetical protein [Lachnospiraceae bacterium]
MWRKLVLIVVLVSLLSVLGSQIFYLRKILVSSGEQGWREDTEESVEAGSDSGKITESTVVITECYDAHGHLTGRQETLAGTELLGNNRLDMVLYAGSYLEQASEEELQAGLERVELEAYSSDSITLAKYYGEPVESEGYFIGVKDNAVIVYLEDRSEVYEYTNIEMWTLPEAVQSQLVEGIYVDNEQELFDFLQTYSS